MIQVKQSNIKIKHNDSGNIKYSPLLDLLIVDHQSGYIDQAKNRIQGIVNQINNNYSVINNLCNGYRSENNYNVGDYAFYNGELYCCISAIQNSTEEFPVNKFTKITIEEQLKKIKKIFQEDISSQYSEQKIYNVDDYCLYNDKLYKCKNKVTNSTWNENNWQETNLIEYIGSLKNRINSLNANEISYDSTNLNYESGTVGHKLTETTNAINNITENLNSDNSRLSNLQQNKFDNPVNNELGTANQVLIKTENGSVWSNNLQLANETINSLESNKINKPSSSVSNGSILMKTQNGLEWEPVPNSLDITTTVEDWLEENISTPQNVVIDNTLTISNAVAEAQATGNLIIAGTQQPTQESNKIWINQDYGNSVEEIQISTYEDLTNIVANQYSNKAYKNGEYFINEGILYRVTADITAANNTGIGAVSKTRVTLGAEIDGLKSAKISKPTTSPDGTLGMVLQSNGDGTTEWVSLAGLNPALNTDDLFKYANVTWNANNEHRQISKNDDGSYSVWIDENTADNLMFHNSENTIPEWIIPGCTYRLKYNADLIDGDVFKSFAMRVYVYQNGTSSSTRIFIDVKDGTFKIPANTTGIIIRLQKDAGAAINCTVKPELYLLNAQSVEIRDYDADMKIVPSEVVQWQDFTQVGEEIWFIASSNNNHSTADGYIYRINKDSFNYIGSMTHNIGHCNGIDYDQDHDALIVLSGQSNDSHVFIYKNVSSWVSESTIDFSMVDKIDIDLSSVGSIAYACACWGEKKQNGFRYVYIANDMGNNWIKLDLSILNNFYTNNYTVVWKKPCMPGTVSGINTAQVLQGMTMHKGKFYASISHNPIFGAVYSVRGDEIIREIIHVDGTGYSDINEGCTFVNDTLLLGVSSNKVVAQINI